MSEFIPPKAWHKLLRNVQGFKCGDRVRMLHEDPGVKAWATVVGVQGSAENPILLLVLESTK